MLMWLYIGPSWYKPIYLTYTTTTTKTRQQDIEIPQNIYELRVQDWYLGNWLPANLHTIIIQHSRFNEIIDTLPENLLHLAILNQKFNHPLTLPPKLQHLTFCEISEFNQCFEAMPPLTFLKFGDGYNSPIQLPQTLLYLLFGQSFNHPIDVFPPNLIQVTFGSDFCQNISKLPNTVKRLVLGEAFDFPDFHYPPALEQLILISNTEKLPRPFPSTLTHFASNAADHEYHQDMPPSITHYACHFHNLITMDEDYIPKYLYLLYDNVIIQMNAGEDDNFTYKIFIDENEGREISLNP